MENPTLPLLVESLLAELEMHLTAYNLSLENDEMVEARKKIALRIVEIERNLIGRDEPYRLGRTL